METNENVKVHESHIFPKIIKIILINRSYLIKAALILRFYTETQQLFNNFTVISSHKKHLKGKFQRSKRPLGQIKGLSPKLREPIAYFQGIS